MQKRKKRMTPNCSNFDVKDDVNDGIGVSA